LVGSPGLGKRVERSAVTGAGLGIEGTAGCGPGCAGAAGWAGVAGWAVWSLEGVTGTGAAGAGDAGAASTGAGGVVAGTGGVWARTETGPRAMRATRKVERSRIGKDLTRESEREF